MKSFKLPSAYTILFIIIALMVGLTWIVPAGTYEQTFNQALQEETPLPGTFENVESTL